MNAKRRPLNYSETAEPFDVPVQGLDPRDDEQVPIVPYIPFLCPFCSTSRKPRTHGPHNGKGDRVRRHECQACGRRYRSLEMPASAVPNWPALRPDPQRGQ